MILSYQICTRFKLSIHLFRCIQYTSLFTDSLICFSEGYAFYAAVGLSVVTFTSERIKPFSPPSLFLWSPFFPDFLVFLAAVERPRYDDGLPRPRGAARALRDRDLVDFGFALRLRVRDVVRRTGLDATALVFLAPVERPRYDDVWSVPEDWPTGAAAAFDGSVAAAVAGLEGTADV